jgi:type IV secretion system protein VirD4
MTRHPSPDGWGPQHQAPASPARRRVRKVVIGIIYIWIGAHTLTGLLALGILCWLARRFGPHLRATARRRWQDRRNHPRARATDPLVEARGRALDAGGGAYLGVDRRGGWCVSPAEHGLLLLGPPRSGKTSGVIIPSVLAHTGPVVSTSTKADVLQATGGARSEQGRVWEFDPTGRGATPGVQRLRWSPVTAAGGWDGALVMARAMVSGSRIGAGVTDSTHWSKRATALLAAVLHAASVDGQAIDVVCDWIARHDLDTPGAVLTHAGSLQACRLLVGLQNTEARERSSICSAALDALDAYSSDAALVAASDPNFDADAFVAGEDTVYIHAPAEDQALAAPLICGLLSEIRRATYLAYRDGRLNGRVLWALDEAANIAPLEELPAVASEGGGQGLTVLASFQDLSQARARWGTAADGFLTLFGSKLVLPGIADTATLEAISVALGEYDRRMQSTSTQRRRGRGLFAPADEGTTTSTHRQRVLSPGEIANIPYGRALHLNGLRWQLVQVTAAHTSDPWRMLTGQPILQSIGDAGETGR